jgi:tetratricopeptide (TPR) repeat protein
VRRALIIGCLSLIALTLLASIRWGSALWGLSSWAAVSPFIALLCAIIVSPQLFLASRPDPFRRIPPVRSSALRAVATVAISAGILWLLRSKQELWGDRGSLGLSIAHGAYRPSSALATFFEQALYRFVNGVFLWTADSVIFLFGVLACVLYVYGAFRASLLLFPESDSLGERRLAVAFLLSSGFVAPFFGSGVNVAIAAALSLAFIIVGVRHIRGERSLALPASLLAAAMLAHVSSAYLLPPFFYLVGASFGRSARRKRAVGAGAALVVGWLLLEAIARRAWGVAGPIGHLSRALIGSYAAAARKGWSDLPRSLWLAVNTVFIIGPSSVIALSLAGGRGRGPGSRPRDGTWHERRFLLVCAMSGLLMLIAGSPLIDGGLRWYAFAAAGPSFAAYALWSLKQRTPEGESPARALWVFVLIGVFQLAPLLAVDAVPRMAEKRILELPLPPGRGEMIMADAALDRRKLDAAKALYLASLEKNPANVAANDRLGRIEMRQEDYAAAISHFLNAHELKPADPHYRFELADALIANHWFPEAIAQLETLTTAYPDSVEFWRKLGFARNNGHRYEPAIAAYERALALEPKNEQNVRNLVSAILNRAAELQQEGKSADARSLYDRAIALYPDDWRAFNNLAILEMDSGNTKKAYEILADALKRHPYEPSLHFNMGIVLERRGRLKEALEQMRTAQELDPVYSKAPMHIERLEKELGIWKPNRDGSSGAPSNAP